MSQNRVTYTNGVESLASEFLTATGDVITDFISVGDVAATTLDVITG